MSAPPRAAKRDFPYWLVALIGLCAAMGTAIALDGEVYRPLAETIGTGLFVTVWVTLASFACACFLGLWLALLQRSRFLVLRQGARFYIELIRGVPMLVLLAYIGFVAIPWAVDLYRSAFAQGIAAGRLPDLAVRDVPFAIRAVIALTIAYSAFIAEVFRAGLESVGEGQSEAARALGLKPFQTFRLVILPQAFRTMLPPLGNDLINLVKDSSLVSALGVADVAYQGKVAASKTFRYFEAYNVTAFFYLVLTLGLAMALRRLERHLERRRTG